MRMKLSSARKARKSSMVGNSKLETRRRARVRRQIRKSANGRPRLSVFRSNKYIYAQVIDDLSGRTVAAASSREKSVTAGDGQDAAITVGRLVAERATKQGVKEVVFDRGPYLYHGRVKALAEAAREGGLTF